MTRIVALVAAAALLAAGCGGTRVVHVVDKRPRIRDNATSLARVRANFAGKPAQEGDQPDGSHCLIYGSPQKMIDAGDAPVWVIQVCYREPKS